MCYINESNKDWTYTVNSEYCAFSVYKLAVKKKLEATINVDEHWEIVSLQIKSLPTDLIKD